MNEPAREEAIFMAALEKGTFQERRAYVEGACAGDPELLERVRELLRAHEQSRGPLDAPPAGLGATSAEPSMLERPGTEIGPYKLREQIGEGGFGVVYVAEQEKPVRRKVALKIVKPGMDTKDVVARFEAERQALALMDHPNVARVFDAGTTDSGRPYFVMELVHGVSITDFCDKNNLTSRQRLELFIDICRAVQHAHQKGIIHRDLKPSNIMVTLHDGRPVPKVIDFGVSKALCQQLTEKTIYTSYGQMIGTPVYMSPEQAEMSGLGIDTRSDVYSLGVLLYELLTGKTPFDAQRLRASGYAEMLRIIREEEPPRPSLKVSTLGDEATVIVQHRRTDVRKLSQNLHGELDWIVMKALDKDRDRRYETANALAADIQHYLHEEAVEACPPSPVYRLKKFTRRHRRLIATAAAMLIILLAGTAVSIWQTVRATQAERLALRAHQSEKLQRRMAERERDRAIETEQLAEQRLVETQAEKARADQQRDIAQAVHDFLRADLMGQEMAVRARGERGYEPGMDFPELLERAAKTLDGRFESEPLTEAAIRLAVGDSYRMLRQYEEARKHLERSVELRTAALGAQNPTTLDSKWHLAELYHDQQKYDEAEAILMEVLQGYAASKGADDPHTLATQNSLALLYHAQEMYERAEPLYQEGLQTATRVLGSNHKLTLTLKNNLAGLYRDQQQYDRAERLYEEVVEGRASTLGSDHPDTRVARANLARVYRVRGKADQAKALLEQSASASPSGPFQGPINAAIRNKKSIMFVTPTNEDDQAVQELIHRYAQVIKERFLAEAMIITDQEALERDLSAYALMIYGTPSGNLWLAKHLPDLAARVEAAAHLAGAGEEADELRFITAWPNPSDTNKGMIIYTARHAKPIVDINEVFHGPTDYVIARGKLVLHSGDYEKEASSWSLPPDLKPRD